LEAGPGDHQVDVSDVSGRRISIDLPDQMHALQSEQRYAGFLERFHYLEQLLLDQEVSKTVSAVIVAELVFHIGGD
jgi:hypothetical protein